MKKSVFTLLFTLSVAVLYAPAEQHDLLIEQSDGIESYNPLLNAVYWHECGGNEMAYNESEGAVGPFQIRQVRVDHYNQLIGTTYRLKDFYSYELSREMFLYFTCHDAQGREIPNKSWEQAAKNWNGSGEMTEVYWKQIKERL